MKYWLKLDVTDGILWYFNKIPGRSSRSWGQNYFDYVTLQEPLAPIQTSELATLCNVVGVTYLFNCEFCLFLFDFSVIHGLAYKEGSLWKKTPDQVEKTADKFFELSCLWWEYDVFRLTLWWRLTRRHTQCHLLANYNEMQQWSLTFEQCGVSPKRGN